MNELKNRAVTDEQKKLNETIRHTNALKTKVDAVIADNGQVSAISMGNGLYTGQDFTTEITLTAAEIVGNTAGKMAHTAGAPLIADPGAGKVLEFISAVIISKFGVAAYTGGGDDITIRVGTVAQTSAISIANIVTNAANAVMRIGALATQVVLTAGGTINLFAGTAITNPGTAAGELWVQVKYRIHETNL